MANANSSSVARKLASSVAQDEEISKVLDQSSASDVFPKLGVNVEYLIAWHRDLVKNDQISLEATTTDVCEKIVKPLTFGTNLAYANLIQQQNSLDTVHAFGTATHFVSHAWKYKFCDLVAALEMSFNSMSKEERQPGVTYFWVDLFAVDQHHACCRPHEWWATTFVQAIKDFGKVILVFHPFLDPIPLQRAWCLWEIFSAIKTQAAIDLAMPTEQWTEFRFRLRENYRSVLSTVSAVDARKADAFNPLDKAAIFDAIEREVGFDKLNAFVRNKIAGILLCGAVRESSRDENFQRVIEIIDEGADVDTVATHLSPLGVACDMNCLPLVTILLDRGASINAPMSWGHTPLHLACRGGHALICKALLAAGADIAAVNAFGRTPADEIEHLLNGSKDTTSTAMNVVAKLPTASPDQTITDNQSKFTTSDEVNASGSINEALVKQLELLHTAVEGAFSALNQLSKSDVSEAKSMSKPPGPLNAVITCTCLLMAIIPNEKNPTRDNYWNTAKRQLLSNSNFLTIMKGRMQDVLNGDAGNASVISEDALSEATAITNEDIFDSDKLLSCGRLAWALGIWCRALIFGLNLKPAILAASKTQTETEKHATDVTLLIPSDSSLATDVEKVALLEKEYHGRCRECLAILNEHLVAVSKSVEAGR
jgi:hypothetical protein